MNGCEKSQGSRVKGRSAWKKKRASEASPFVFSVDVGPVMEQVLHHRHPVVASSKVQGSGVASLQIAAVDVLGGAQLLQGRDRMRLRERPGDSQRKEKVE